MVSTEDWSSWEEHIDDGGRHFLANRATNQTKWVWQKWNLNGRIFCLNVRTNERVWVEDMNPSLRLEAGVASQNEVDHYRAQHTAPKPAAPAQASNSFNSNPDHSHVPSSAAIPAQTDSRFQRQYYPNYNPYPHANSQVRSATFNSASSAFPSHAVHPSTYDVLRGVQSAPEAGRHPKTGHPENGSNWRNDWHSNGHNGHRGPANQAGNSNNFYNQHRQTPQQACASAQATLHSGFNLKPRDTPFQTYNRAPDTERTWKQSMDSFSKSGAHNFSNPSSHPFSANSDHPSFEKKLRAKRTAKKFENSYSENRYWNTDYFSPASKRAKTEDTQINVQEARVHKQRSRFGQGTEELSNRAFAPRAKPRDIDPESVPSRYRYSKYVPLSKDAKKLLSNVKSVVQDSCRVGVLHDRDFPLTGREKSQESMIRSVGFDEEDFDFEPVVGKCVVIEKDYLRLTSAPKPSEVRPPHILEKALKRVKSRWKQEEVDYDWTCRQLKSIRQDYKVQHIESKATIEVYETHARLALENGDLGEFNTCVAQAQDLYGKVGRRDDVKDEFSAYRILYNIVVDVNEWEQAKLLSQFSVAERKRPATRFALDVRRTVLFCNYHHFFVLYANQPPRTMVSYLLDRLVPRIRSKALAIAATAYAPGQPPILPVSFLISELGWREDTDETGESDSDTPDGSKSPSSSQESKDEQSYRDQLIQLGMEDQPYWVRKALVFIMKINGVIELGPKDAKGSINGLFLNCKATKQRGVRLSEKTGLITHAGAAFGKA